MRDVGALLTEGSAKTESEGLDTAIGCKILLTLLRKGIGNPCSVISPEWVAYVA
jgi:hypothetical protein